MASPVARERRAVAGAPPWQQLGRRRSAAIEAALVGLFALVAIVGPFIALCPPGQGDLKHARLGFVPRPSVRQPAGLDRQAPDELWRLLHGALIVVMGAVVVGLAVGVAVAAVAGVAGRRVDTCLCA